MSPHPTQSLAQTLGALWCSVPRYRTVLVFQLALVTLILTFAFFTPTPDAEPQGAELAKRHGGSGFGGFSIRPQDERCFKQEKVATLLSVYLGVFGADHWYARHWVLATFKLLTLGGLGVWWFIDVAFWVVGGFYGTPGCAGGCGREWLC
ncbi:hypothetical protein BU23DRAFT_544986 [Bimuria novae-zelandiae CBS 107.79]|uniref:TM2 domain-containing protein n=1 Tax=Bimuria novae-zelandiae CBS 107.79 TaxID=1447943 RepID=A0A6A5UNW7_9PLEO|nr:hypothetical protein BU23DRAFT_544986 [Bimuria novae-zelandiae CBS 107.79]